MTLDNRQKPPHHYAEYSLFKGLVTVSCKI